MGMLKQRFQKALERGGTQVLVNGGTLVQAFAQELQGAVLSAYVSSSEYAGLTRPALQLLVSSDTALATGDSVNWSGRTYHVQKRFTGSLCGENVCQVVVLW